MQTLPLLLLASYAMCFGLMNEKAPLLTDLLTRIGFFKRMFECAFCTGFHTGWVTWGLWRVGGGGGFETGLGLLEGILFAFVSSTFCYSYDVLLRWLER